MSTNSLLLSLLANSSANPRSTSLMLKNTISNPYSSFARSSSISHAQKIVKAKKEADEQHNVSLVRLNHMLNLKVKNHYYFFFCKLQQNLKQYKHDENTNKNRQITQIVDNEMVSQAQKPSIKYNQQRNMEKDLSAFCDSVNTVISKGEILLQRTKIVYTFNSIKSFANKIKAISLLTNQISKHNQSKLRFAINAFHQLEKQKMRNQILQISLNQTITQHLSNTFQTIKRYVKQKAETIINNTDQFQSINQNNLIKDDDQRTSNEKVNRAKKIILKQKKISFANPLTFTAKKSSISINQDSNLQISKEFTNDKKMGICLNMKHDMKVNCLADLNDNCFLFGEHSIQIPYITINTAFTIDNFSTEEEIDKKSCYTDRTRRKSIQLKATPKYSRQKYPVSINKKEVHLQNQSPLAKIDQILNRIQQLKANKSQKSKQKKTVSINLSKEIHKSSHPSIIKYRKAPINKEQKENMQQRLITEREVNSKGKSNGFGLQSATKYKSTVLQKGRQKEGQISTARKMKMQIENIINRRNKQLYRVESTQLN